MMMRRAIQICLSVCFALVLLANINVKNPTTASARPAAKNLMAVGGDDLSGNYKITYASNPGGGSYDGSVRISRLGDAYRIVWTMTAGQSYEGVGLQIGNMLAVGWGIGGGKNGVVAYRINGGTLKGVWTLSHMKGATGTEELAGSPELRGSYKIVSSTTPGAGKGYAGTVNLTPHGDTYAVAWRLASGESYTGVGIRQGDVLVVGWGISQDSVGVVSYRAEGATLVGVWAIPGGESLGAETLTRR